MAQLLYNPRFEHDACGIGFVARIDAEPRRAVVELALQALGSLNHRGAVAADGLSGDGAGLLTTLPVLFLQQELDRLGIADRAEQLGVGMIFGPQAPAAWTTARELISAALDQHGLTIAGWREVPLNHAVLGAAAQASCPTIAQVFIARPPALDNATFERILYRARRRIEQLATHHNLQLYLPSFSCRTLVYKGLITPDMLADFYPDLADPAYSAAAAVYHQRYSTNTFPTWERAQPFRIVSHNGEINTLAGNVNWMRAREPLLACPELGDMAALRPIIDQNGSDSAQLDNVVELLVRAGRDPRHALALMVPEAWEAAADLPAAWRDFYGWHAHVMEPWDGPAALTFCDGNVVGSVLDRNGLRPARYLLTDDGTVIMGSESGAACVPEERIISKGRLGPGQMLAIDLNQRVLMDNSAIKDWLAAQHPYRTWLRESQVMLDDIVAHCTQPPQPIQEVPAQQRMFGYNAESLALIIKPMLQTSKEPLGSMGDDTVAAVFSSFGRPVYSYLKQRFAQVTNPPIDPLRERCVMSLQIRLGARHNLLAESPQHSAQILLPTPVLNDQHLAALRQYQRRNFSCVTLDATCPYTRAADWLEQALDDLCAAADRALDAGATLLIISDRSSGPQRMPIPSLLALGRVHQHLIASGRRSACSLLVESGDAYEVHHIAALIGYGAEAVNPYLALGSVSILVEERSQTSLTTAQAQANYCEALNQGLLKIMSKMGIATIDSYCGAQVFEALGLASLLVERCFTDTPQLAGKADFARFGREVRQRHETAWQAEQPLSHPGFYTFKKDGEHHAFQPAVVHALQRAVRSASETDWNTAYQAYQAYTALLYQQGPRDLRDLLQWTPTTPIALEDVEPISAIVRRFSTAAISHGSLSREAHETLAQAMNQLGGLSNSGEGGEDPQRYGTDRESAIKQIASGRFGVHGAYLMHARELQIKMAQGSKPGEGGQIPGAKVSPEIAAIRHTVPGVTLISPPPHHDIYSIEDLAQLIYDLHTINPGADISVKLVAESGVGTIAAGVVKGGADVVLISGHAGGTGASPLSSIKHAGLPWEIGLAETQQTLVLNKLRGRVRLRVDGGLRTGRDVVLAALLGADEFSFGTAALIAEGCVMARACHKNTCPVGIATQRADLRAKFPGSVEHVVAFMQFIAQEVRELLAQLGVRTLNEIIGRVDLLHQQPAAQDIELQRLLGDADPQAHTPRHWDGSKRHFMVDTLNQHLLETSLTALRNGADLRLTQPITNQNRATATTLAGQLALLANHGKATLEFIGSAGQSFGAWATRGMHLMLIGDANDYVGKGLAGGEIVVRPSDAAQYAPHEAVILGNTVLYGATSGSLYAAGQAGERFAVRNSGATAVVEGIGDHGCEYMTGGTVVILGRTGRNFGAGMTAGQAFVFDPTNHFIQQLSPELPPATRLQSPLLADHLRMLLEQHWERTGSPLAAEILACWQTAVASFWYVAPAATAAIQAEPHPAQAAA